jgi:hypothetical protein
MPLLRTTAVLWLIAASIAADRPSLRAFYRSSPPSIAVTASDSVGLDSLQLSCPTLDITYTTQLPRATSGKRFERNFVLSEVSSALNSTKEAVQVIVTVRNTRGATASTTISVSPGLPRKPN